MNPSPLRYPGGKYKLYPYVEQLISLNNCTTYIEPFCGGAAIAIQLLLSGKVKKVIINDFDYSIFCFWHCILDETDDFINRIKNTEVTIDEWEAQKAIRNELDQHDMLEIGFSTFFLNRTNRSGIIDKAGPIGGIGQKGNYLIDCRFNKTKLIEQIKEISRLKDKIEVYNYEALDFIDKIILNTRKSFIFFDPPYYGKGPELYQNAYTHGDHLNLSQEIMGKLGRRRWIVTYDDINEIKAMYDKMDHLRFSLQYTLQAKRKGTEIMFFSKRTVRPSDEERYLQILF